MHRQEREPCSSICENCTDIKGPGEAQPKRPQSGRSTAQMTPRTGEWAWQAGSGGSKVREEGARRAAGRTLENICGNRRRLVSGSATPHRRNCAGRGSCANSICFMEYWSADADQGRNRKLITLQKTKTNTITPAYHQSP